MPGVSDEQQSAGVAIFDLPPAPEPDDLSRLRDLLDTLPTGVRVIIMRGFAGVPLLEATPDEPVQRLIAGIVDLLEGAGRPLIAILDSLVAGPLTEIALACHWRVGTAATAFRFHPALRGCARPSLLTRILSSPVASEILLTGRLVESAEALSLRILQQRFESRQQVEEFCLHLAETLSTGAPLAHRFTIESVRHGSALPLPRALALESALFARALSTDDAREGIAAFLDKRPPFFCGR